MPLGVTEGESEAAALEVAGRVAKGVREEEAEGVTRALREAEGVKDGGAERLAVAVCASLIGGAALGVGGDVGGALRDAAPLRVAPSEAELLMQGEAEGGAVRLADALVERVPLPVRRALREAPNKGEGVALRLGWGVEDLAAVVEREPKLEREGEELGVEDTVARADAEPDGVSEGRAERDGERELRALRDGREAEEVAETGAEGVAEAEPVAEGQPDTVRDSEVERMLE